MPKEIQSRKRQGVRLVRRRSARNISRCARPAGINGLPGLHISAGPLNGLNDRAPTAPQKSGVRGLFLPDRLSLVPGQGFVALCLLQTGLPQGLGLRLLGEPAQIGGSFLVTSVFQRLRPDCMRRTIRAGRRFAPQISVT